MKLITKASNAQRKGPHMGALSRIRCCFLAVETTFKEPGQALSRRQWFPAECGEGKRR